MGMHKDGDNHYKRRFNIMRIDNLLAKTILVLVISVLAIPLILLSGLMLYSQCFVVTRDLVSDDSFWRDPDIFDLDSNRAIVFFVNNGIWRGGFRARRLDMAKIKALYEVTYGKHE